MASIRGTTGPESLPQLRQFRARQMIWALLAVDGGLRVLLSLKRSPSFDFMMAAFSGS